LLTATFKDLHIKTAKITKGVLFSSTLTHSQCDAGNIITSKTAKITKDDIARITLTVCQCAAE